jgi:nitroreductase
MAKNILNEAPAFNYHEKAPKINADEFQKVVDSRRSVRLFEDEPVPEDVIKVCLENALLAPNSSNLQPWEIYRIKNKTTRNMINSACLDQTAAVTAAELFIFVARTGTWRDHADEMLALFNKGGSDVPKAAKKYYGQIVPFVYSQGVFNVFGCFKRILYSVKGFSSAIIREPVNMHHMRTWAVKSTALACENFMLSMRAYGFDSCPMEGYDSSRIKKILKLPKDAVVVMAVGTGRRKQGGIWGKRIRFESSRFLNEV